MAGISEGGGVVICHGREPVAPRPRGGNNSSTCVRLSVWSARLYGLTTVSVLKPPRAPEISLKDPVYVACPFSLFAHGSYSWVSSCAKRAFNTLEGAMTTLTAAGKQCVDRQKTPGIADEENIHTLGTNARLRELKAAIGLLQLNHFAHVRCERVDPLYRTLSVRMDGILALAIQAKVEGNASYFHSWAAVRSCVRTAGCTIYSRHAAFAAGRVSSRSCPTWPCAADSRSACPAVCRWLTTRWPASRACRAISIAPMRKWSGSSRRRVRPEGAGPWPR